MRGGGGDGRDFWAQREEVGGDNRDAKDTWKEER